MTEQKKTKQHEFRAEVKQLLDILANSLYTNKEIFVRELVSNASDALDKVRFEINRGAEVRDKDLPLEIRISCDKEKKLLTITDTGLGLTEEEAINNLGTIAKSGSAEFMEQMAGEQNNLEGIIGKFGVGFYSVFMAAEKVVVKSQSYLPEAGPVAWSSDGSGVFELEDLEPGRQRGTVIEVHLKDDELSFAEADRLKDIIKRHSNFIGFPIYVEDEQVNTIPAIWREPKFSLKQEQYNEFYKFLTFDSQDPFETIHISVDAPVQFNALLFIPQTSHDMPGFNQERPGVDLYVQRVLIQKGNKDLIPEYLGFVRGVVDSEDLPLNISRETLQENLVLGKIAKNLTKQVVSHLQKMADKEPERYLEFWREHGKTFKLGYMDFANRERYAELLRFNSSASDDAEGLTSLAEYVERKKTDQNDIYYVSGPSREAFELNPHMEIFRKKGVEVLYLFEPLDEFALEALAKYKEYNFKSVEHADTKDLDKFESTEEDKKQTPLSSEDKEVFDRFLEHVKDVLGDRVTKVKVSTRLSDSPCCLVNPDDGMTSSMQKIMHIVNKDASIPTKVLEINQDHQLIRNLLEVFKGNPTDSYLKDVLEQLFESALLTEGYLKDPHQMVARIQSLMDKSSSWYLSVKNAK
ncbi:molecular chaperone HtpG [Dethiosulfatarculus sandiegensis]|uniref:Chaperone protein HtpG n=1 Tax=Dethiosulfatarculus sandiegensis TaxID=1429043 RepID=A0A0D2J0F2_9BACT|nr:molecular chaperone HtpG [Dethiosulfatarculus sandiegensis]KIX11719.1 molecular chaperone Hsp90 [Dethiosulfatarculus sandiegensis]